MPGILEIKQHECNVLNGLASYIHTYIPGQQLLQETLVIFSPKHFLPPQLGLGWVHVRC